MEGPASLLTPANIALYAIAINFLAFVAFGFDKILAENDGPRTPEAHLLGLAFLGGSPGAYAGRNLFRHKTRKQPFSGQLHSIVLLQTAVLVAFVAWRAFSQ